MTVQNAFIDVIGGSGFPFDTRPAAEVEKAVSQGFRTTALGKVKWCRALGQGRSPRYHIGIRYYPHY